MSSDQPMAEIDGAHTLRFIRRVDAPPERVWRAITDASELRAWTGMHLSVEPKVGGKVVAQPGSGWVFDYDPPRLLRFSAADLNVPEHVEAAKKTWTISWELTPDGSGTRIVFLHRFLRGDQLWGLGDGWHGFLDQLIAYADRGEHAPTLDHSKINWAEHADDLLRYRDHVARALRANANKASDTEQREYIDALYFIAIQPTARPDYSRT